MLRNFLLINVVLFIIVCFLGVELYGTLRRQMDIPTESSVAVGKKSAQDDETKAQFIRPKSYEIIASANLFNPDRTSKKEEEIVAATPPPKNQPKLFGTIIIGDKKLAILEDPGTRERKTFGISETVGGYVVSGISEDKVVLSWSGEEITIRLREDKGVKPMSKRQPPRREVKKGATPRTARDSNASQRRRRRPRRTRTNVPPKPPNPSPNSVER